MVRIAWILTALCGLGCAGPLAPPAPVAACAEPGVVATGSELQALLHGALRMRLPPGYHVQDSVAGAPDETWSGEGHGVVIFDRARLSEKQIESIRAWGCQKSLADRTVYLRTARGGDYVITYQLTAAWEEAPSDWVYILAMAPEYAAHRDQFAALHTLLR